MTKCNNCGLDIKLVDLPSFPKKYYHFYEGKDWRTISFCDNPQPRKRKKRLKLEAGKE